MSEPIKLLLVDNDVIFRLGLSSVLSNYSEFRVVAQTNISPSVLDTLSEQPIDLVVLDPYATDNNSVGWELVEQIKQTYPNRKLCLLSYVTDPTPLQNAQTMGVDGYCPKGIPLEDLIEQLKQIAQGQTVWPIIGTPPPVDNATLPPERLTSAKPWLLRGKQSGLAQIDATISQINHRLRQSHLSRLDQLFWQGRRRELLAARWLVNQLIPVEVIVVSPPPRSGSPVPSPSSPVNLALTATETVLPIPGFSSPNGLAVVNDTLQKLTTSSKNLTPIPLEIDSLQREKKQELLSIIIHQLGRTLEDLRFVGAEPLTLPKETAILAQRIWQESAINFLGKYCVLRPTITLEDIEEMVDDYIPLVQAEILNKIPFLDELFNYLLFDNGLMIDRTLYRPQSPEAQGKAEMILQNFIIHIGNGIISLVLNNFTDLEPIKEKLYIEKMLSSRELAKFRNTLSWYYRREQYWEEPRNIFESQYRLFFWTERGIETTFIQAPRQEELKQLQGIRWTVTMILETRDALAPPLRSVVGFVGNGLVYLLTQVIGRGIGLIGRGIIQGIGNSLQETRYGKNRERRDSPP